MFELSFQFELTRFFLKELYKYLPNSYNLLTRGCAWGVSLVPVISISNYFQFLHNKNKFKKYTKNYQIILKKTRAKYWKSSLEKIPSNIHDNNNLIIRKKKNIFNWRLTNQSWLFSISVSPVWNQISNWWPNKCMLKWIVETTTVSVSIF